MFKPDWDVTMILPYFRTGILLVIGVAAVRGAVVIGIGPYHLHHLGIGRSLAALQKPKSGDVKLDLAVIQSAELLFAEDEEPVRHDGHLLIWSLNTTGEMFVFRYQGSLPPAEIFTVSTAFLMPAVFLEFLLVAVRVISCKDWLAATALQAAGEPVPLHLLIILELVDDGWAALDEEGCQRHQAENAHRSSRHSQDCQHDQYSPQELDPLDLLEQLIVLGGPECVGISSKSPSEHRCSPPSDLAAAVQHPPAGPTTASPCSST